MPRAPICDYLGKAIRIENLLPIWKDARRNGTTLKGCGCIECNEPVGPVNASGHSPEYFRHLTGNPQCPLSSAYRE